MFMYIEAHCMLNAYFRSMLSIKNLYFNICVLNILPLNVKEMHCFESIKILTNTYILIALIKRTI